MRIASLAASAVLALGACSRHDAADQATYVAPRPAPTATGQAVRDSAVAPEIGAIRTFGDWAVGCDNLKSCTMASLGPADGAGPKLVMSATRKAGAASDYSLTFSTPGAADPSTTPVSVTFDGRVIQVVATDGETARAIVASMAAGRIMTVRTAEANDRVSLDGAAAALRYIDAQQNRVGTVTATVATGPGPADTAAAQRTAPTIVAVTPAGSPAMPSTAQMGTMRRLAHCRDQTIASRPAAFPVRRFALGGGRTLLLLPCSAGAYNVSSVPFVLDGARVALAKLDAKSGFAATPVGSDVPSVVNGAFDDGVLTSFAKGRGLGDCGVRQAFVWDGARFRLAHQSAMPECRGNPDFIDQWQTNVVRD